MVGGFFCSLSYLKICFIACSIEKLQINEFFSPFYLAMPLFLLNFARVIGTHAEHIKIKLILHDN